MACKKKEKCSSNYDEDIKKFIKEKEGGRWWAYLSDVFEIKFVVFFN